MSTVFRPRRALWTAIALSAVLIVAAGLGWVLLPAEIQAQFTVPQLATLAFFVGVMVVFMMSLGLSYVRVENDQLVFRNGLRTHRLGWDQIRGFRFGENDPWAYVLTVGEPEQRALLGIQRTDAEHADADLVEIEQAWRTAREGR